MLARCSRCESTFVTSQFGRQRCPKCQDVVFVEDPMNPLPAGADSAYAPPGVQATGGDGTAANQGDAIPWERRHELGFWPALGGTLKLALTEPTAFFSRMRYDTLEGAHLFYFLVTAVPWMIGMLIEQLLAPGKQAQLDQLKDLPDAIKKLFVAFGAPDPDTLARQTTEAMRHYIEQSNSIASVIQGLIFIPVACFAGLYLMAGIAHLALKIFNKAGGGWNATLKAFIYAFSPGPLLALPMCGGLLMMCWATALQVIGLSKGHRVTTGYATLGVLSFHALGWCCICIPASMLMMFLASMMGLHAT